MSTLAEIDTAVAVFKARNCSFELMHCNSTYPMNPKDANLMLIASLAERYGCKVGYSGHETGTLLSVCAVAAGATSIERHITLDRTMYGSDQKASIEPAEVFELVQHIRLIEEALGSGKKTLSPAEDAMRKKLRN
jgi:N-acetylneuraminate synthase